MQKTTFDYAALNGRIVEKFGTKHLFATASGFSDSGLSHRLNGRTEWSSDEIYHVCGLLDIDMNDVQRYFFCPKT